MHLVKILLTHLNSIDLNYYVSNRQVQVPRKAIPECNGKSDECRSGERRKITK